MAQGRVGVSQAMRVTSPGGSTGAGTGSVFLASVSATTTVAALDLATLSFSGLNVASNPGNIIDVSNNRLAFPSTGVWLIVTIIRESGANPSGGGVEVLTIIRDSTGALLHQELFNEYMPAGSGYLLTCTTGPRTLTGGTTISYQFENDTASSLSPHIWSIEGIRLA